MGTYVRKAFSFGPLRLNLSRSGLGASFGVKGARIGVGPRGMYVHAGRGGLYYRQFLSPGLRPQGVASTPPPAPAGPAGGLQEIESSGTDQMADSSSAELLQELNRVRARTQVMPIVLICGLVMGVGLMMAQSPAWVYGIAAAVLLISSLYARHVDVTHGTAILRYSLDPEAEASFSRLKTGFDQLSSCSAIWHVQATGKTDDWKRNAGATGVIRRQITRPHFSVPPRVECNIEAPTIPAGAQTLYFFPDRVLVYDRSGVGAVEYGELVVEVGQTRFIEEDQVPADAQVIDRTWKYVNKKGGPDRRFSNNRELPVLSYGVVRLTSGSGLNEMFNCSNPSSAEAFASSIPRPAHSPSG